MPDWLTHFLTDFGGLVRDPAHWAFDLTVEFVTGLAFYPVVRKLIAIHDQRKHSNGHKDG